MGLNKGLRLPISVCMQRTVKKGKTMDANTVFKRIAGANYNEIKQNPKLITAFLAIDGQRSIKTIASTNHYDIDDLILIVDQIEKMGLIIPVDGAKIKGNEILSTASVAKSPAAYQPGIAAADEHHQGNRTYIFRGARVEEVDH